MNRFLGFGFLFAGLILWITAGCTRILSPVSPSNSTPTSTPNPSFSPTPTFSTTPTPGACAKVGFYTAGPSDESVSAGSTITGLSFGITQENNCTQGFTITNLFFTVSTTGNLNSQITEVQLFQGSNLVGSVQNSNPLATSFDVSGLSLNPTGTYITLKYTLSPNASGTIQTTLTNAFGTGPAGFSPDLLPFQTGVITVESAASPTPIATNTFTGIPTGTPTVTYTSTPGFTTSATPTATGCAVVLLAQTPLPSTFASAGTTVTGMVFSAGGTDSPCYLKVFTELDFTANIGGNLSTEISSAQLWSGTSFIESVPFNASGFSFTGPSLVGVGGSYSVRYVSSLAASGTIQTTLTYAAGTGGGYPIQLLTFPYTFPISGAFLDITNLSTPTFTITQTPTGTPSPTQSATATITSTPEASACVTFGDMEVTGVTFSQLPVDSYASSAFTLGSSCGGTLTEAGFFASAASSGSAEIAVYDSNYNQIFLQSATVPAGSGSWISTNISLPVNCGGEYILSVHSLAPGIAIGMADTSSCLGDTGTYIPNMPAVYPHNTLLSSSPAEGSCPKMFLTTCGS